MIFLLKLRDVHPLIVHFFINPIYFLEKGIILTEFFGGGRIIFTHYYWMHPDYYYYWIKIDAEG